MNEQISAGGGSTAWLRLVVVVVVVGGIFAALRWQGQKEADEFLALQQSEAIQARLPKRPTELTEFDPIEVCPPIAPLITPSRLKELDEAVTQQETRAFDRSPWLLTADEVKDEITDNELVIGVVINDAARAYPVNMLTGPDREIINDRLGGRNIAATW